MSTPHRRLRSVAIPGIDTRAAIEQTATALTYGGWLTPPQSAHEGRRPSLAFSNLSDAPYSGPSSVGPFSQPATPVHNTNVSGDQFANHSFEHPDVEASLATGHFTPFPHSQAAEPLFHIAYQHSFGCGPNNGHALPTCEPAASGAGADIFGAHMNADQASHALHWSCSQLPSQAMPSDAAGLRSTLFPSNSSLVPEPATTASLYNHSSMSMQSFEAYNSHAASYFLQDPQVIVPSELSPQDECFTQHYSTFASPDQSNVDSSASFENASTSFSSYDVIEPPSPDRAYFAASEDDEWVNIKIEATHSPTPSSSLRRRRSGNGSPSTSNLTLRTRKKSQRRTRKTQAPCKAFERGGIHFQIEGPDFDVGFENGKYVAITTEEPTTSKPHRCLHVEPTGGVCGARFDRAEHLKRHMGKHNSGDRPYPCPVPYCKKKFTAIQRSDNAKDHFKTHLKHGKGKRNPFCPWSDLEILIRESYNEKLARSLVGPLQRWVLERAQEDAIAAYPSPSASY